MSEASLLVETEAAIAFLTLANPGRRNALSMEVMASITEAVRKIGAGSSVRAVILRAEGPVFLLRP